MAVIMIFLTFYIIGWTLLTQTSARLLLPDKYAAWDRLTYVLDGSSTFSSVSSLVESIRVKLYILCHLFKAYLIVLPFVSYLWALDEVLYGKEYRNVKIEKPLITISVPRAGTTSFHRTLALDTEHYVTPVMLELVMPFLCVQKVIYAINHQFPIFIQRLETFLKWINGVTPQVEARHPISLFAPDADDILLGEWHWVSVGAVRSFPVLSYWKQHYEMKQHPSTQQRSMELHQCLCQKILFHRGCVQKLPQDGSSTLIPSRRLLLRSHLSPCIGTFQNLYPDAIFVGILRNPVEVLCSFAGLSATAVYAASGVNMLDTSIADATTMTTSVPTTDKSSAATTTTKTWPQCFVEILSDMMGREMDAMHGKSEGNRCYVTFPEFKANPLESIRDLYGRIGLPMTKSFQEAIQKGFSHHEVYKVRHSYKNPTLEEMDIDEETFLKLPNVQAYQQKSMSNQATNGF